MYKIINNKDIENNDKDIENNEKSIMLNNSFYNENNIINYTKLLIDKYFIAVSNILLLRINDFLEVDFLYILNVIKNTQNADFIKYCFEKFNYYDKILKPEYPSDNSYYILKNSTLNTKLRNTPDDDYKNVFTFLNNNYFTPKQALTLICNILQCMNYNIIYNILSEFYYSFAFLFVYDILYIDEPIYINSKTNEPCNDLLHIFQNDCNYITKISVFKYSKALKKYNIKYFNIKDDNYINIFIYYALEHCTPLDCFKLLFYPNNYINIINILQIFENSEIPTSILDLFMNQIKETDTLLIFQLVQLSKLHVICTNFINNIEKYNIEDYLETIGSNDLLDIILLLNPIDNLLLLDKFDILNRYL